MSFGRESHEPGQRAVAGSDVALLRTVVVGAGGHARVVVRALQLTGVQVDALYDDDRRLWGSQLYGVDVPGPIAASGAAEDVCGVVAIGDNETRRRVSQRLTLRWISVVHPHSFVDGTAALGRGTVVLAGAMVQPEAKIGDHCIVNTGATVDHDCIVGNFAHLAPGVHVAGGVEIGAGAFLGVGANIVPGVRIGENTVVGAGATVTDDLPANVVAAGTPATVRRESQGRGAA
jgi:acetyltransferase EpsM